MLNVHSQFSLRYGILSTLQIRDLVKELGYSEIVLTDINSSAAVLNYIREAQEAGVAPKVGIDFRNGTVQQFVGIAMNNEGYCELNTFLSAHLESREPFPDSAPRFEHCFVVYPFRKAPAVLHANERIGVRTDQLNNVRYTAVRSDLSQMVILQPMTFRHKRDYDTHRLLRAIDRNCLLSLLPSSELADNTDLFVPKACLYAAFSDFPELITNTEQLLSQCSIHFDFGDNALPQNLSTYTGSRAGDLELLRKLIDEGLSYRYPTLNTAITERIEKELNVLDRKNYLSYFLITWDIINYARKKGYYYVGRGSGANSIIAYLIRITDVDPLELDLYFERFINLFRKNPPDFDIDFSWKDRDDITQYIFRRFPSAALLCTYSTFKRRAAIRELGKVFGLPKSETDVLLSRFAPLKPDRESLLVLQNSKHITGLPSHLSIHAGGILISEKPITWYSATFMPPKGYRTTQFSMLEAEDVGLFKFDILSQRGLAKIHDCIEIARYNQPDKPVHDIHDLNRFKEDKRIRKMLSEGDAKGCFYVESPAMRMLLLKLKVGDYLTLVAASSIIRPGVAQSGMMQQYILRHLDANERKSAHPRMSELMPETYGVMVYQEDVIKVAHELAGLSLAEADVLRRGMSGKYRSRQEFQMAREKFFSNCLEKGETFETTAEIWRQIESFAGYSFSKGHSASYAVESYQALYLKAYYPLEYMTATMNNGGGFYSVETYIHEARLLGATIEEPSVNYGSYECIICGTTIYLGFMLVNGIEVSVMSVIFSERQKNGLFRSFEELLQRVNIPLEQLRLIIRIGGLRDLCASSETLIWKAWAYHNKARTRSTSATLFDAPVVQYAVPEPEPQHPLKHAFEQIELFSFPLCNVFDLLAEPYDHARFISASQIREVVGKEVEMMGKLIAYKEFTTSRGNSMYFGTFLDIKGEQFDTVHFERSALSYPFRGEGIYRIAGKVTEDHGFYSVTVDRMQKMPLMKDVRVAD